MGTAPSGEEAPQPETNQEDQTRSESFETEEAPPDKSSLTADVVRLIDDGGAQAALNGLPPEDEDLETVPVQFRWPHGGNEVYVCGGFNGWRGKMLMAQSPDNPDEWNLVLRVVPKFYHYRFIVDQQWRVNPDDPIATVDGVASNTIDVKPSVFEDPRTAYEDSGEDEDIPDDHKNLNYSQRIPKPSEYIKDAPKLPPHYATSVLNTPLLDVDPYQLPIPLHVTLNHLSVLEDSGPDVIVTSISQRFRTKSFANTGSKFVTTVYYAPRISTPS